MTRLIAGILWLAMASMPAISQSSSTRKVDWRQDKAQVLRLIDWNEAEVRKAEVTHGDREHLVSKYSALAVLYTDAGMGLKTEDAFRRALALLKDGPQDRLADELEQLGVLQMAMGELRQAERDEMQALEIRQALGDPVGLALAESQIAGIYDFERKFAKARDHAEKAYDALAGRADVDAADRIGVWHTLGFALTGLQNCERGIEVLKDALEMARSNPGPGDASLGYSEYLLGFGYWQCSDRDHAAAWLQRGTTDMTAEFGFGHAMYVNAMKQYAQFLRQYGQLEEAVAAEAVVHQAESVVDANTLTTRAGSRLSSP